MSALLALHLSPVNTLPSVLRVVGGGCIDRDERAASLLRNGQEEDNAENKTQHDPTDDELGKGTAQGGAIRPRIWLDVFCLGHERRLACNG